MSGKLATNLELVTHDLEALRKPGFWAVVGSFESNWTLAKFEKVIEAPSIPNHFNEKPWRGISIDSWRSSFSKSEYLEYVTHIRNRISAGDVYQVNACRVLSADNRENKSLLPLAQMIAQQNPAPFSSYISLPGLEIASASPERFISMNGKSVISSPIKGTSSTAAFLEKDKAENLMIVDLIRNDLGTVAKIGSVKTPRLLATEEHPGLFHLVSDVSAELADDFDIVDLLKSVMPPGSVSGAPKSSAVKIIKSFEGDRGPYCGAIGWFDGNRAELAVGIRTFWQEEDQVLRFGTGAGITWGSDPDAEWEETELKARRLIAIAGGKLRSEPSKVKSSSGSL